MALTEQEKRIIEKLKITGYGWSKFAKNVENQGYCSDRQRNILIEMHQKVTHMELIKQVNFGKQKLYKNDISDCEAMSFGEYF